MSNNQLKAKDRAIHDWYRFVLAYPPHLVREYLEKFEADPEKDCIYDPFSGTATTPVEARLNGFSVIGTDANPVAVLANRVKLNWTINLEQVNERLDRVINFAVDAMRATGLEPLLEEEKQPVLFEEFSSISAIQSILMDNHHCISNGTFNPDQYIDTDARKVLPKNFISPEPMKRALAIRYAIESVVDEQATRDFMFLALASTILITAGNIAFGPEIYSTKPKDDAPVLLGFYDTVKQMVSDMSDIQSGAGKLPPAYVARDDARKLTALQKMPEIDIVITSPPYPNEKDYTRATRLENVMLGYINSRQELRALKEHLLRSNTRNVFVADEDDRYIRDIASITTLASKIENRRLELGKTSGFEKLYHRVVSLYFGGMYRHLEQLYPHLRKGGKCAYVVGDQMSFFRILIPTANLLADVATEIGYKVAGIETWRNRFSTVTKQQIEENVLILTRPE